MVSLQGRAHGTEAFFTLESLDASTAPPIESVVRRVASIVKNLLTFARQEKQSHSPAYLADIVSAVLSLIQTVMRHDQIDLQVDIPRDLPKFKCRGQQIQQVLMNLMTNARDALNERYPDYSPQKKLQISARLFEKDGRHVDLATIRDIAAGMERPSSNAIIMT